MKMTLHTLFLTFLITGSLVGAPTTQRELEKAQITFAPVPGEDAIDFDRELIPGPINKTTLEIEGMRYEGRLDEEDEHEQLKPWVGQAEFLHRLYALEKYAEQFQEWARTPTADGSYMRLLPDIEVASRFRNFGYNGRYKEFTDHKNEVSWRSHFGRHYVAKFNIKPSREFYRYVMNYHDDLLHKRKDHMYAVAYIETVMEESKNKEDAAELFRLAVREVAAALA